MTQVMLGKDTSFDCILRPMVEKRLRMTDDGMHSENNLNKPGELGARTRIRCN